MKGVLKIAVFFLSFLYIIPAYAASVPIIEFAANQHTSTGSTNVITLSTDSGDDIECSVQIATGNSITSVEVGSTVMTQFAGNGLINSPTQFYLVGAGTGSSVTITGNFGISGSTTLTCVDISGTNGEIPTNFVRNTASASNTLTTSITTQAADALILYGIQGPAGSSITSYGSNATHIIPGTNAFYNGSTANVGTFTNTLTASLSTGTFNAWNIEIDPATGGGGGGNPPEVMLIGTSTATSSLAAVAVTIGSVWDSYWEFWVFSVGLFLAFVLFESLFMLLDPKKEGDSITGKQFVDWQDTGASRRSRKRGEYDIF